jgi:DNA mismatch endonuclease (patch repair protein)
MAKIGAGLRKNRVELRVHEALKGARIRHRMYPDVRPSADVEIPTRRGPLYLMIDGCFWHACPDHYRRPKTRVRFWKRHIETAEAFRRAEREVAPFPFVRIWEHWVRDPVNARDMVVGMTRAAVAKVESGAVTRGPVGITWDDLNAEWGT